MIRGRSAPAPAPAYATLDLGGDDRDMAALVAIELRLLGPDHPRTLHVQRVQLRSWKNLPGDPTRETVAFAERLSAASSRCSARSTTT